MELADILHCTFSFIFQSLRVEPSPQDGVRILAGGLSLVLQSISRKNSGNYSCIAYNLEGEDTSNTINIDVMCKYIRIFFNSFLYKQSNSRIDSALYILES